MQVQTELVKVRQLKADVHALCGYLKSLENQSFERKSTRVHYHLQRAQKLDIKDASAVDAALRLLEHCRQDDLENYKRELKAALDRLLHGILEAEKWDAESASTSTGRSIYCRVFATMLRRSELARRQVIAAEVEKQLYRAKACRKARKIAKLREDLILCKDVLAASSNKQSHTIRTRKLASRNSSIAVQTCQEAQELKAQVEIAKAELPCFEVERLNTELQTANEKFEFKQKEFEQSEKNWEQKIDSIRKEKNLALEKEIRKIHELQQSLDQFQRSTRTAQLEIQRLGEAEEASRETIIALQFRLKTAQQQDLHQLNIIRQLESKLISHAPPEIAQYHQRIASIEHTLAREQQHSMQLQFQHERILAVEREKVSHAMMRLEETAKDLEIANLCLAERKKQREQQEVVFRAFQSALSKRQLPQILRRHRSFPSILMP